MLLLRGLMSYQKGAERFSPWFALQRDEAVIVISLGRSARIPCWRDLIRFISLNKQTWGRELGKRSKGGLVKVAT